jgi:hypothetical protein
VDEVYINIEVVFSFLPEIMVFLASIFRYVICDKLRTEIKLVFAHWWLVACVFIEPFLANGRKLATFRKRLKDNNYARYEYLM